MLQNGQVRYSGPISGLRERMSIRSELVVELSSDHGEWKGVTIPGVDISQPSVGWLVFHIDDPSKWDSYVPLIIGSLLNAGCPIRSVNRHDPKLEDIYMAYVGGSQ
jgi:hypothetical protein